MKILQILFIAIVGAVSFATVLTSETLHQPSEIAERVAMAPAPDSR